VPQLVDAYLQSGSPWAPTIPGVEPLADNLLINGQNTYDCSVLSTTYNATANLSQPPPACDGGSLFNTTIKPGETVRLRLISHASFLSFWFSIDNHEVTIVEIDGTPIKPIPNQRGVHVNIGQRYSVLVTASQTVGNYLMRATLPRTCFLPYATYTSAGLAAQGYQARAILSYAGTELSAPPLGVPGNTSNPFGVENNFAHEDVWEGCDDMPFDMAEPAEARRAVEPTPENTYSVFFQFRQAGRVNRIFINRTSWSPYTDDAQLWLAMEQDFVPGKGGGYNNWDFRLDQQVLLLPEANKGAQIAINSMDIMAHPFHMQ
jgi:FtsP/CotA-like multicopper oxidase with cupredoxin domain